MTETVNETKYYLLSWYNVTPEEDEMLEKLSERQAAKKFNFLASAFIKTLPDVTGDMLKKLTAAGAEPKFIQNTYAMGIVFKTSNVDFCDKLSNDPHVLLVPDVPEELYVDPDAYHEKIFGSPDKTHVAVERMDIGTIVPKL